MGREEEEIEKESVPESEAEEKPTLLQEILSWVIPFALAFLVAFGLKTYVIINADVPTGSMENTIMPEDRLIGYRLAYLRDGPERGDIVIFHYPDDEEELYVKRVIGLPGETIDIVDGEVFIDGGEEPLAEPYLKEEWTVAFDGFHFEVPDGAYLMMGDNRNNSWDARFWANTYVYADKILGKAEFVYWPIRNAGSLYD